MMFDLSIVLDILFLLLAIYFFPGVPGSTTNTAPHTPRTTAQANFKEVDTPLPSPLPAHLRTTTPAAGTPSAAVPRIILHPSHTCANLHAGLTIPVERPNHKRKSVSFSISSMKDLLPAGSSPSKEYAKQHRPATPWMKGPASPSELLGSLSESEGSSPMPSPVPPMPSALESQGGNGQRMFGAQGRLGVTVADPDAEDFGEPIISPKICSRDVVDTMGIKKSWLMS